ncbi:hypothetical protein SNOG_01475 [Parastagonospora nodorum SN15]|uniref:Uncharacterized protein n=1 Tax=Phaeosphaeria nodorum (strain SN15 / ATCC MYA-4574 / FGSC 10173) TaxID=321614 RepID=Q0V3D9_PHANO|nr:hypothetical protein SNOG_01475 [Parastagonospora nodorum SN15]EAT91124.1 hypothetical protein SNOG_01475 [Parastagonospora nodorum SN15]
MLRFNFTRATIKFLLTSAACDVKLMFFRAVLDKSGIRNRLDYRSVANRVFGPAVKELHDDFAEEVWSASTAKFGVILGMPSIRRYLRRRPLAKHDIISMSTESSQCYGMRSEELPWHDRDARQSRSTESTKNNEFQQHSMSIQKAESWYSTPGANVMPTKLHELAIERMWGVAMALSLGRVSRVSMMVYHEKPYEPLRLPPEHYHRPE